MKAINGQLPFWFLVIPTLVLGGLTFYLLRHEQERQDRQNLETAQFQARTLVDQIRNQIHGEQDDLIEGVHRLERTTLIEDLVEEKRTNPLIRNVFFWKPDQGLIYPRVGSDLEERKFLVRYQSIFSARGEWPLAQADEQEGSASSANTLTQSLQQKKSKLAPPTVRGWQNWFWEDKTFVIGWVEDPLDGSIRGVELEMAFVWSKVISTLILPKPVVGGFALLDQSGKVFFQLGELKEGHPQVLVPIGSPLDHWQVGAYLAPTASGSGATLIIGSLLLIFALTAILLSGYTLRRQMRQQMWEARHKTRFVSNVSHELKTPLTTIRMYTELLREGRITDPEKRNQYLEVITSQSQRLTRLVNNVLDFSRLERGQRRFHWQVLDLVDIATEIAETQKQRFEERNGLLLVHQAEPAMARVDRDAVEQIVLNLLDNTLKYGAGSEPATGAKTEIRICRRDGFFELSVADHGPGIPHQHRDKIFDKFYRIDDALTADQNGSGIGLSIARLLAMQMDGTLRYCDREGGGAEFVLSLPCMETGHREEGP